MLRDSFEAITEWDFLHAPSSPALPDFSKGSALPPLPDTDTKIRNAWQGLSLIVRGCGRGCRLLRVLPTQCSCGVVLPIAVHAPVHEAATQQPHSSACTRGMKHCMACSHQSCSCGRRCGAGAGAGRGCRGAVVAAGGVVAAAVREGAAAAAAQGAGDGQPVHRGRHAGHPGLPPQVTLMPGRCSASLLHWLHTHTQVTC
jgi:hypothetical protein